MFTLLGQKNQPNPRAIAATIEKDMVAMTERVRRSMKNLIIHFYKTNVSINICERVVSCSVMVLCIAMYKHQESRRALVRARRAHNESCKKAPVRTCGYFMQMPRD